MKVIESGIKAKPKNKYPFPFQVKCMVCFALLEVENESDIQYSAYGEAVQCPECFQNVDVESWKL